jgi:hypothetical protein
VKPLRHLLSIEDLRVNVASDRRALFGRPDPLGALLAPAPRPDEMPIRVATTPAGATLFIDGDEKQTKTAGPTGNERDLPSERSASLRQRSNFMPTRPAPTAAPSHSAVERPDCCLSFIVLLRSVGPSQMPSLFRLTMFKGTHHAA